MWSECCRSFETVEYICSSWVRPHNEGSVPFGAAIWLLCLTQMWVYLRICHFNIVGQWTIQTSSMQNLALHVGQGTLLDNQVWGLCWSWRLANHRPKQKRHHMGLQKHCWHSDSLSIPVVKIQTVMLVIIDPNMNTVFPLLTLKIYYKLISLNLKSDFLCLSKGKKHVSLFLT